MARPCALPDCRREGPHEHVRPAPGPALEPGPAGALEPGLAGEPAPETLEPATSRKATREAGAETSAPPDPLEEDAGGASPEVGRQCADDTTDDRWSAQWVETLAELAAAERWIDEARARRLGLLREMRRAGATMATMAEHAGISKQAVSKLLAGRRRR